MNGVRHIQSVIAVVFLGLGGWCLVHPSNVIALTMRPQARAEGTLPLVSLGAFGAQAMLVGILAACARFARRSFLGRVGAHFASGCS